MTHSDSGKIPTRVIVIQLVFLVIAAGLFAYVKLYAPQMEKARANAQIAERESRIQDFFDSMVAEDYGRMVVAPGVGKTHPKSLKSTPSVAEVEQTLGAPDKSTTDFAGGFHITWNGTGHTLVGSFNHGQLYCLTLKNNSTGHGENVYESSDHWAPF